ncbi:lytic polysaccharide monooxygenase [Actinoplanes oblitus]|uniref:Lytic polysaccharide monooxygenase n=1 Tax=Actinoplanes oblitus TaxID=3040509 RepID=A0ABY8W734_9ACTN|nr:lytic polysaccharide monooxygenase [Actinoplanes oblitus]WIM93649.1 lytic polysaccharide monooxygenase [Actinoplanes oblitus]
MRLFIVLAAVGAAVVPAGPVFAHGAPTTPISRSAACAGNGTSTTAAACKAAKAATGGFLGAFDNVRIAGVNGNDRKVVPDGKLCSAGLADYRGLDLPRDDFPATTVKPGQRLGIAYKGTIPHQGQFRIFLTEPGYDSSKRLTWDDLGSKPIGTFTDPPLTGGAYRMSVKLPERTGRQMLYVVWETSSTPDTYYSCSDLVFPAAAKPVVKKTTAAPKKTTRPVATKSAAPVTEASSPTPEQTTQEPVLAATTGPADDPADVGHWLIAGALGAGAIAGVIALLGRRRRRS